MLRHLLLLAALGHGLPAGARAQAVPPDVARVTLIPGWVQPDGTRMAAIAVALAPGWHTYWRAPGAAGLPPQFDWSGSDNLADARPEWPRPKVFDTAGSPAIGYTGTLVLPVALTPERAEAPIALALDLFFGVCDEICVPARARIDAVLAPGDPPGGRDRIEAALADRPLAAGPAGVVSATCALAPVADGLELRAEITFAEAPGPGQTAVIESPRPDLWIGAATTRIEGRTVRAFARIEAGSGGLVLDRQALRLTVIDDRRAVNIHGCGAPG